MSIGIRETSGKMTNESEFNEYVCHTEEDIRRYIKEKFQGLLMKICGK